MYKALLVVAALLAAVAPAGAGEAVLYSFADGTDGGGPSGNVTIAGGDLYGTAHFGGITTCGGFVGGGCGVVYRLTAAQGGWTEQALYAFGDGADGGFPNAGVVVDTSGNVYGAASTGGNTACSIGCGVVYEVSPHGSGWSERVLHGFDGTDGEFPNAPLWVDPAGDFYSTTWHGGASGSGEVFALKHSGNTWSATVLHAFNGTTEGLGPAGGVVLTPSGRIFGTTYVYNGQTDGTVYELVRAHRAWHDDVLQTFQGSANGCNPYAGLIADARGNLYGTTVSGGASGSGTVYELAHTKRGYVEHILYSFGGGADGANPGGGVILDGSGDLFGVTSGGGASGAGTVYEITP